MYIDEITGWADYELLDSGNGQRLERFGSAVLSRPDPQAFWKPGLDQSIWSKVDANFSYKNIDRGSWTRLPNQPDNWKMHYNDLNFLCRLTPFKHTGVFPEQVHQWDFIKEKIKESPKPVKLLNLFAYTGIPTLSALASGAEVTHVDASKPAITWANENVKASGLSDKPVRWIVDDVVSFVIREVNRGHKYDAVLLDPPVYGHGPDGQVWDFHKDFPKLLNLIKKILSPKPLFVLVNAYAVTISAITLGQTLADLIGMGNITYGELALKEKSAGRLLSTGIFAKCEF